MSTVFVHIGQCGNQIGQQFWQKNAFAAEESSNVKRAFWTPGGPGRDKDGHLRAVFIDSEKKVLQKLVNQSKKFRKSAVGLQFGHGNLVSCAKGCGSNWALGHNRLPHEKVVDPWPLQTYSYSQEFDYGSEESLLKASMEAIRREVEACDCFSGFVTWNSLGGGTGSGFGSRLCQELRERYPVAYQMSVAITPHSSGDCPTQPYNEVLCLSSLQEYSDAIILFENDDVLDQLSRLQSTSKYHSVSYDEMNAYIADCMANLVMPVSSLTPPSGVTVCIEPWELIRSVAPMHNLKLLQCRTVAETLSTKPGFAVPWDKLANQLCQQTRFHFMQVISAETSIAATLAAVCVCRNVGRMNKKGHHRELDIAKLATKVKKATQCVKWNPFPIDIWTDESKNCKTSLKSLTLCSNLSTLGTVHCAEVLHSAKLKLSAKAYLHWYERYGTYESDFQHSFEVIQGIVDEYAKAAAP